MSFDTSIVSISDCELVSGSSRLRFRKVYLSSASAAAESACLLPAGLLASDSEAMMGESIYNLIPQPVAPVVKPERYISKHSGDKPPTFSTFGLSGTSKPGYKNIAGAEASMPEGHHNYGKSHATMGKEGNAKKPAGVKGKLGAFLKTRKEFTLTGDKVSLA